MVDRSKVTRVFLVRHGATILSAEDRFAGETDVLLSDEGRRQTLALANRLRRESISAIYASPMKRTRETAEVLAAPHGIPVVIRDGLREISHGRWEGKSRSEVEEQFPDEYLCWQEDPFSFAPAGGETGLAVTARALPDLLAIVAENQGRCALIVSHKATIRLLISNVLGFDPRTYRDTLDQDPACLNILDFRSPTRARLILFNDISHYAQTPSLISEISVGRLSPWWDKDPSA